MSFVFWAFSWARRTSDFTNFGKWISTQSTAPHQAKLDSGQFAGGRLNDVVKLPTSKLYRARQSRKLVKAVSWLTPAGDPRMSFMACRRSQRYRTENAAISSAEEYANALTIAVEGGVIRRKRVT
jgi:hypothetical protein